MESHFRNNIVLIGMSTCGKSTVGALVANELDMAFLDTDRIIEQTYGMPLGQFLEKLGSSDFIEKESEVLCSLNCTNTCIATGGSAVYSDQAMHVLKQTAHVVFLHLSYPNIEKRMAAIDIKDRGVVMDQGKSLFDVYQERDVLYQAYADYTIEADDLSIEQVVAQVVRLFSKESGMV